MLLQLKTQQFTLQFLCLRGEKQTPPIFILCFYKTLRQLNNTHDDTSPLAHDAMLHFRDVTRKAYILCSMPIRSCSKLDTRLESPMSSTRCKYILFLLTILYQC